MSPRKLTENDKQEILEQYRTSQATTSTLAKSYEVSSSTISRFLKNKLSSAEYEDLIQQKRLARTPRGEKSAKKAKDSTKKTKTTQSKSSKAKSKPEEVQIDIDVAIDETELVATPESVPDAVATPSVRDTLSGFASEAEPDADFSSETHASEEVAVDDTAIEKEIATQSEAESKPTTIPRRRRRRPTTASESAPDITRVESPTPQDEPEKVTNRLVLDKKVIKIDESEALASDKPAPTLKEEASWSGVEETLSSQKNTPIDNSPLSQRLILKSDRLESEPEEDEDDVDLITLKEMLGEDLEDFNDDEDDEDDEDWEEEDISYRSSNLGDVQILPLSQASFPRTCYLVIDRSAELIVKPLSEFADLGMIPTEENREKTLPVFDNHRIAKRFSNRRERIIKVPDGSMLQKTSRYLQDKGITRLLIDGQIYSLIN